MISIAVMADLHDGRFESLSRDLQTRYSDSRRPLTLIPSQEMVVSIETDVRHFASGMDARQGEDPLGLPLCRQPDPQGDAPLNPQMIRNLKQRHPEWEERYHSWFRRIIMRSPRLART